MARNAMRLLCALTLEVDEACKLFAHDEKPMKGQRGLKTQRGLKAQCAPHSLERSYTSSLSSPAWAVCLLLLVSLVLWLACRGSCVALLPLRRSARPGFVAHACTPAYARKHLLQTRGSDVHESALDRATTYVPAYSRARASIQACSARQAMCASADAEGRMQTRSKHTRARAHMLSRRERTSTRCQPPRHASNTHMSQRTQP
eukprot:2069418-Pleurochrysis_carterae.AAC.1